MVKAHIRPRYVALVVYEDGDSEELYLDQLCQHLLPEGALPPAEGTDPGVGAGAALLRDRRLIRCARPGHKVRGWCCTVRAWGQRLTAAAF